MRDGEEGGVGLLGELRKMGISDSRLGRLAEGGVCGWVIDFGFACQEERRVR